MYLFGMMVVEIMEKVKAHSKIISWKKNCQLYGALLLNSYYLTEIKYDFRLEGSILKNKNYGIFLLSSLS